MEVMLNSPFVLLSFSLSCSVAFTIMYCGVTQFLLSQMQHSRYKSDVLLEMIFFRFALAFGALPVMIAFPFRRRMHETETFQRVAEERQTCSMKSRGGGGGGGAGGFGPFGGSGSSGADGGGFATADTPLSSQMHSNYGATYGSSDKSLSNDGTYNAQNILSEERYGAGPQKKNNIAGSKTKTSSGAATALAASENVDINGKRSSTGAWIGEGPGIKNLKQFRQERSKLLNPGTEERELEMQMVTDSVVQENAMFHLPGDYTPVDTGSSSESHNNNGGNIHHPHHHHAFKCETTHLGEIHRAFKYYKWHMLGTSLCWFLLDVDFYANGLFNHEITSSVFSTPGQSNTALQDAYYTLILSVIALPGYYLSVMYIDKVGRKNVQMLGFTMMGLLFLLCSLSYEWLMDEKGGSGRKYLFLLFYALTFLFRYTFLTL